MDQAFVLSTRLKKTLNTEAFGPTSVIIVVLASWVLIAVSLYWLIGAITLLLSHLFSLTAGAIEDIAGKLVEGCILLVVGMSGRIFIRILTCIETLNKKIDNVLRLEDDQQKQSDQSIDKGE